MRPPSQSGYCPYSLIRTVLTLSSWSVLIRAPTSLVEMKSTIHEVTRTARRRLVFCDASCDFVDRPLPSNKKNFKMTHYPPYTFLALAWQRRVKYQRLTHTLPRFRKLVRRSELMSSERIGANEFP